MPCCPFARRSTGRLPSVPITAKATCASAPGWATSSDSRFPLFFWRRLAPASAFPRFAFRASVPVVALANNIPGRDKMVGNIQECIARKSPVIATATDGDTEIQNMVEDVIWIPECSKFVSVVPTVVALQLLAYYIGIAKDLDVDKPRNLAKSVTVE